MRRERPKETLKDAEREEARKLLDKLMELDEVFYSLRNEDILRIARDMRIPKKKLTPEIIDRIKRRVEDEIKEHVEEVMQKAISDVIHEKEEKMNKPLAFNKKRLKIQR